MDPRFPLSVAFSDDETFSPPASPGPAGFVANSKPSRSSVPVLVPAVENERASVSPTTSPTLPSQFRLDPRHGRGHDGTNYGCGVCELVNYFRVGVIARNFISAS